jgi:hypothetical protein
VLVRRMREEVAARESERAPLQEAAE